MQLHRSVGCLVLNIAVAGATLSLGCGDRRDQASFPEGYTYAPIEWPVAWRPETGELVAIHLERAVDAHGGMTLCDGSGWYLSVPGEASRRALEGALPDEVCKLDLRPEVVGASTFATELLLSDDGDLLSFDLETAIVTRIEVQGVRVTPHAAWSQDGGRIAFAGKPAAGLRRDAGNFLYLIDRDGSGLRLLTELGDRNLYSNPAWSPDNAQLVLSTAAIGGGPFRTDGHVIIVNAATGEQRHVAAGYFPSWSPDGKWIAYLSVPVLETASADPSAPSDSTGVVLRLVRPDGTEDHVLFADPGADTPPERRLKNGWPWAPLLWSPDANRLAFTRLRDGGMDVWILDTARGELESRGP